jgi:hypothetical protein
MRGRRILEAAYTQRLLESKGVSSRRGRSIHGALRGERAEKVKLDIVMADDCIQACRGVPLLLRGRRR